MASITNDNFPVSSKDFFALIPFCDFYAWDLEMTGIRANDVAIPSNGHPLLKLPKDAFREKITAARRFDIIQLGVSLFFKEGTPVPDVVTARPAYWNKTMLDELRAADPSKTGPASDEELAKIQRRQQLKRSSTDYLPHRLTPFVEKALRSVDEILGGSTSPTPALIERAIAFLQKEVDQLRRQSAELQRAGEARAPQVRNLVQAESLSFQEGTFLMEHFNDLRTHNTHFESFSELAETLSRLHDLLDGKGRWRTFAERTALVPIEGRGGERGAAQAGYTVRAFSMYIFPNADIEPSRTVVLDAETCGIFLTKNSPIDFNHWIRNGARYVTRETMTDLRLKTLHTFNVGAPSQDPTAPSDLSPQDADTFIRVAKRFQSGEDSINPGFLSQEIFRHVANYAYKLGYTKEGKLWKRQSRGGDPIAAKRVTPFDESKSSQYGAACLVEALINSRKPCVIHNGLSDLAFLLAKFHRDVPNSYGGFKALVSACFPVVYDTRTLTTLECFSHVVNRGRMDKTYDNFIKMYGNQTFDVHVPDTGCELLNQAAHDAAADAFKTGKMFLMMQTALAKEEGSSRIDYTHFCNLLPVYESVFSIHFGMDADCYVAKSVATPVWVLTTPDRLFNRFDGICSRLAMDVGIPTTPMGGPNTDTILFSDSRAPVFGRGLSAEGIEMIRAKIENSMKQFLKVAAVRQLDVAGVLKARMGEIVSFWPSSSADAASS